MHERKNIYYIKSRDDSWMEGIIEHKIKETIK